MLVPQKPSDRGGWARRRTDGRGHVNVDPTAGHELVAGGKVSEAVAAGAARQLEAAELTAVTTLRAVRHQVCGDICTLFAPPAVR
jgi:hypothetical protein